MDTLQILQAISDRGMSASLYVGSTYVYESKWKISIIDTRGSTKVETTSTGDSFEKTLQDAWLNITRKDAA